MYELSMRQPAGSKCSEVSVEAQASGPVSCLGAVARMKRLAHKPSWLPPGVTAQVHLLMHKQTFVPTNVVVWVALVSILLHIIDLFS